MKAGCRAALPPAAGLFLFADYLFLALQRDVASSIPVLVGVTAVAVMVLAALFYMGGKGEVHLSPAAVLGLALACRLLFLFKAPGLSDDINRFLWDGLQVLHGNNPYRLTPAASTAFDALSGAILGKVNHPQFFTIYPPAAQAVFAAGAALAKNYTGLKILLIVLDMAGCLLIIRLLRAMNLPPWRAVLYAWHPLPIIEIAWSGHVDGAAIFFLLATISFIMRPSSGIKIPGKGGGSILPRSLPRYLAGGATLGLSALIKVIPLIYLPVFLCAAASPFAMAAGCAAAMVLSSIPFLPHLTHMFSSLGVYARNWEFANAAFRTFRTLLGSGDQARLVLMGLAAILILAAAFSLRRRSGRQGGGGPGDLMQSLYLITFVFLLLTPTLHPWYALYLAAFLPFSAGPAGLVLSWTVFLSYHVLIGYSILGQWVESDLIAAAIWLAPVAAWAASFAARKRSRNPSNHLTGGP